MGSTFSTAIHRQGRAMDDDDSSDVDMDLSGNSDVNETYVAALLRNLIRNNSQTRFRNNSNEAWYSDDDLEGDADFMPDPSGASKAEMTGSCSKVDIKPLVLDNTVSGGKRASVARMITQRENGMNGSLQFTRGDQCSIYSRFLPNKGAVVQRYHHKIFCGTYSIDGALFLTASQDRNLRLYKTDDPTFTLNKILQARDVGWSVLDTAFSPDGTHLIYSSWSECVHLCNIYSDSERHKALLFCPDDRRFCIFSVTFSQDGNEILGGANDGCIYVYDVKSNRRNLKILSHDDDVNTVAFVDASSQILFSGGDDGLCKVWDRRTLSETFPKPVGILAGHRDGITFVDPRGDGRHLITNSKDQSIKLWDMRKFSPSVGVEAGLRAVSSRHWDYRRCLPKKFSAANSRSLIGDTSLMTYRGHTVLQTLIRCRFSPAFTTEQRFIYTGCTSGQVIIYDVLTGKIVKTLNKHKECVRDVSWHPYKPEIISTSWDCSVMHWTYKEDLSNDADIKRVAYGSDDDDDDYDDHGVQTRCRRGDPAFRRRYNLRQHPFPLE